MLILAALVAVHKTRPATMRRISKEAIKRTVAASLLLAIAGVAGVMAPQTFIASTVVIAEGQLVTWATIGTDDASRRVIGEAAPGEELIVLRCIDLKHYLVPEVALRDGTVGYIVEGTFGLRRKFPWPSFGC